MQTMLLVKPKELRKTQEQREDRREVIQSEYNVQYVLPELSEAQKPIVHTLKSSQAIRLRLLDRCLLLIFLIYSTAISLLYALFLD